MTTIMNDTLSKRRLKMWIRFLGVARSAEGQMREFLRVTHRTTLPRFDVLAALHRRREAVTMSELGRLLLVSNGNVTAVVDRLELDGLAKRTTSNSDRRTIYVALTNKGLKQFEVLAVDHEREINALFRNLAGDELESLMQLLKCMGKMGKGERA